MDRDKSGNSFTHYKFVCVSCDCMCVLESFYVVIKQSHKFNLIYTMHIGENWKKNYIKSTLIKTLHRLIMSAYLQGHDIYTFVNKQEHCY